MSAGNVGPEAKTAVIDKGVMSFWTGWTSFRHLRRTSLSITIPLELLTSPPQSNPQSES